MLEHSRTEEPSDAIASEPLTLRSTRIHPRRVLHPLVVIGDPRQDKQQIAESIQVDDQLLGDARFVPPHEGDDPPLGSSTDRPCKV